MRSANGLRVAVLTRAVTPLHGVGGLERSTHDLVQHLLTRGARVELFTRPPTTRESWSHEGLTFHFVPYRSFPGAGRRGTTILDRSTAYPLFGYRLGRADFCYNRFTSLELKSPPFVSTDGKTKSALPACQVTCPPGAITSGAADGMLTKAQKRVTYLKANGYPNANIYPAPGAIATHVIWVLTEAPTTYGIVAA